jgi:hypothetical protein
MHRLRHLPVLLLALLLSACAAGSGTGATSRSNSDVISREELDPMNSFTAYDAISRLRPQWLRQRTPGQAPIVFMNGSQLGGTEVLRSIQVSSLLEIRYRNGRDATTRYGTGYGGGTIELRSQG